jgi:2-polyprenyl-6-methoxyphenol hydroxylase-like FAD-dependent oxidoreductase
MMAETDVLVVGAGPVGLSLAFELWRHGVSCRIIDQGAGPTDQSVRPKIIVPGARSDVEHLGW